MNTGKDKITMGKVFILTAVSASSLGLSGCGHTLNGVGLDLQLMQNRVRERVQRSQAPSVDAPARATVNQTDAAAAQWQYYH